MRLRRCLILVECPCGAGRGQGWRGERRWSCGVGGLEGEARGKAAAVESEHKREEYGESARIINSERDDAPRFTEKVKSEHFCLPFAFKDTHHHDSSYSPANEDLDVPRV